MNFASAAIEILSALTTAANLFVIAAGLSLVDQTYLLHTHHWRDAASYVATTRARVQTEVFVGRDQASTPRTLAAQMARQSDRGSTLRYQAGAEREQQRAAVLERGYEAGV